MKLYKGIRGSGAVLDDLTRKGDVGAENAWILF